MLLCFTQSSSFTVIGAIYERAGRQGVQRPGFLEGVRDVKWNGWLGWKGGNGSWEEVHG